VEAVEQVEHFLRIDLFAIGWRPRRPDESFIQPPDPPDPPAGAGLVKICRRFQSILMPGGCWRMSCANLCIRQIRQPVLIGR
jgi:hypothetical protein